MRKTNLVLYDEFLDLLSKPIKPSYFNVEDLEYCMRMYAVSSPNFYAHLETKKKPTFKNNTEVSLSCKNIRDVPVQIPLPSKVEFKNFFSYKDYIKEYKSIATAFARLRYKRVATIKDLDEGKNHWANSITQYKRK